VTVVPYDVGVRQTVIGAVRFCTLPLEIVISEGKFKWNKYPKINNLITAIKAPIRNNEPGELSLCND
jgi:hypothetical protein